MQQATAPPQDFAGSSRDFCKNPVIIRYFIRAYEFLQNPGVFLPLTGSNL